jgi:hypothetical protein
MKITDQDITRNLALTEEEAKQVGEAISNLIYHRRKASLRHEPWASINESYILALKSVAKKLESSNPQN